MDVEIPNQQKEFDKRRAIRNSDLNELSGQIQV